ncbi:hypothetical protein Pelo_10885 [Pelomyxa schiedti]|nr:hypothetical protein Pelo_10885 [Pelomyxa schiedti]
MNSGHGRGVQTRRLVGDSGNKPAASNSRTNLVEHEVRAEIAQLKAILTETLRDLDQALQDEERFRRKVTAVHSRQYELENTYRMLSQELTQLKKEKQERLKEKHFLQSELETQQYRFEQVFNKHVGSEQSAKTLEGTLLRLDAETKHYIDECNQHTSIIQQLNDELALLTSELTSLESTATTNQP